MIEKIVTTVLAKTGYDLVKKLFQDKRSTLKNSFGRALDAAKQWYVEEYGDRYGSRNNRFFDYQVVDAELEKYLTLSLSYLARKKIRLPGLIMNLVKLFEMLCLLTMI